MGVFTRKKKEGVTQSFNFISELNPTFLPFGNNVSQSEVVKICIDRVASQCAKLKPKYIKTKDDKTVSEKSGTLSFLLKHKPNEYMTPYDFIYSDHFISD